MNCRFLLLYIICFSILQASTASAEEPISDNTGQRIALALERIAILLEQANSSSVSTNTLAASDRSEIKCKGKKTLSREHFYLSTNDFKPCENKIVKKCILGGFSNYKPVYLDNRQIKDEDSYNYNYTEATIVYQCE